MELWIRSQDKELLVLAKGFELQNPSYNGGCQIFAVWQNNYQCVGNYKSKERALEVLDELQKRLVGSKKGLITTQNQKGIEFIPFENQVIIYEMPKE